MKIPPLHLTGVVVAILSWVNLASAESVPDLLRQAQEAYLRGDLVTAKDRFTLVYKIDPRNQVAIGYLRTIAVAEAKSPKSSSIQKQLEQLILPKVDLRDATLGSTLDFLKQAATKNSEGKVAVNFVVQLPPEQIGTRTVTLNLTNVPFSEVLRYLGGLADVDFSYEQFAIVVKQHVGATRSVQAALAPVSTPGQ